MKVSLKPTLSALLGLVTFILAILSWNSLNKLPKAQSLEDPNSPFVVHRAKNFVSKMTSFPRRLGSTAHESTQNFLMEELSKLGCTLKIQNTYSATAFRNGIFAAPIENIFCYFPGTHKDTVLLMSHYDSVHLSPGAGDAASGVAIILEVLQKIKEVPRKNSLLVLFTDGEESGLLGAAAFARSEMAKSYPIKVIINLEARGNSGPLALFETINFNSVVAESAASMPLPIGNSFMDFLYQFIPNETDLSIFKTQNISGLNFAFAKGLEHYHKSSDTVENLSLDSLKHAGENIFSLTEDLLNQDLGQIDPSNRRIYQDFLGISLVHYPPQLIQILSLFGIICLGFILFKHKKDFLKFIAYGLIQTLGLAIAIYLSISSYKVINNYWVRDEIISQFYIFYSVVVLIVLLPFYLLQIKALKTLKVQSAGTLVFMALFLYLAFTLNELGTLIVWPAIAIVLHFLIRRKSTFYLALGISALILPQALHSALIADSGTQFLLPTAVLFFGFNLIYSLIDAEFPHRRISQFALSSVLLGLFLIATIIYSSTNKIKRGEYFEILANNVLLMATDKNQKIETTFAQQISDEKKEALLAFLARWGIAPQNVKIYSTESNLDKNPEFIFTQNKNADGSLEYLFDIPKLKYRCVHLLFGTPVFSKNLKINERTPYTVPLKKFSSSLPNELNFIESCQINEVPLNIRFQLAPGSAPIQDLYGIFVEDTRAPAELNLDPQGTIMSHFSNSLFIIKKIAL